MILCILVRILGFLRSLVRVRISVGLVLLRFFRLVFRLLILFWIRNLLCGRRGLLGRLRCSCRVVVLLSRLRARLSGRGIWLLLSWWMVTMVVGRSRTRVAMMRLVRFLLL